MFPVARFYIFLNEIKLNIIIFYHSKVYYFSSLNILLIFYSPNVRLPILMLGVHFISKVSVFLLNFWRSEMNNDK